ncbi:MAG: sporulation protein YunB, partial [Clostridiales bacterium]
DLHRQSVAIPLGAISGSKLLAAVGPNIHVGFTIAATPRIELRDQFSSAGINQTKHSLSLLIQADLLIAVPFEPQKITVATTVLLAEGIIVGNTPDSYVNINAP